MGGPAHVCVMGWSHSLRSVSRGGSHIQVCFEEGGVPPAPMSRGRGGGQVPPRSVAWREESRLWVSGMGEESHPGLWHVGSFAQSFSRGGEEFHPGVWHGKVESHPVFVTRNGMEGGGQVLKGEVQSAAPEFIDPVFAKTSLKRSFSMTENERFGFVFAKTWFIYSGTDL
jgi:hypothetical protein